MASEIPQNQSLNRNPLEFSSEYRKECSDQGKRTANMEKFKEAVIKLANSFPNKPLSETQNSIIQDRFNRFVSVLRTPDHPPYAWMIEEALRELNEERGSSEESISNFIRKEYDALPWSHLTLLKHHLQALCECGSIILTHAQHYLLAGANSTINLGKKCRRKQARREKDSNSEIKRHKQPNGLEAHEFSERGSADVEEPLPTTRMLCQRKRWCKQLLNLERSDPAEHQAPKESSQVTRKQDPFIEVNKYAGKPLSRVLLSRPLIAANLSPLQEQHDVQQQLKRRGRLPKVKPQSGITNDKLLSFTDPHPRQQLDKPEHKRRGRPPSCKLGRKTIIDKELVSSGAQQHTPKKRGRGRPPKAREGE